MATKLGRRLGALAIAILVVAADREIQTQSVVTGGELLRMRLPLQRIQPTPANLKRWATEPRWSFGPFNESRFGFRSVALILERTPFKCETYLNDKRGLIRFIVTTDGARELTIGRFPRNSHQLMSVAAITTRQPAGPGRP